MREEKKKQKIDLNDKKLSDDDLDQVSGGTEAPISPTTYRSPGSDIKAVAWNSIVIDK